jgi:flagellar protein FlaI
MTFSDSQASVQQSYALIPPFAYALIQMDSKSKQYEYKLMEAPLTAKEQEYLNVIKKTLISNLKVTLGTFKNDDDARAFLRKEVLAIKANNKVLKNIDENTTEKIFYHVARDLLGFGIIEPLLKDGSIEDISCDGVNIPIYIWHREYESIRTNLKFLDEIELNNFATKVAQRAGRHISVAQPLLDASLPDGSRINITFAKEITMRGSTFTIRKFKADPLTIVDLISWNTLSEDIAAFFWYALEHGKSLLIAGGTASGKTTLLNSLAMFIRPGNKIVSIEDTAELQIPHENWIQAVARPGFGGYRADGSKRGEVTMYDLLRAALRQRPDFLFVGEVRGEEAYSLFQGMSTGHAGMGTIHGDSSSGVIRRLEAEPMNIPRPMLQALDMICVQRAVRRQGGKKLRRTIEVEEIVEVDQMTDDLVTNKVFSWDATDDTFLNFGKSYILNSIMDDNGFTENTVQEELKRRKDVLHWMVRKKMRSYQEVAKLVFDYFNDPEGTHKNAVKDLRAF